MISENAEGLREIGRKIGERVAPARFALLLRAGKGQPWIYLANGVRQEVFRAIRETRSLVRPGETSGWHTTHADAVEHVAPELEEKAKALGNELVLAGADVVLFLFSETATAYRFTTRDASIAIDELLDGSRGLPS
jgi:hypothetical protein